ncbi:glucosamine kinase [Rhodopseudomonas julia]|uniref:Glucosamine kinase n=1 Tax=Rhodopseudomonas julia TaxID=200617 RepID=A0ABU0C5L4_9BRAD|nr:BadF/BadG/BcrA/BcrD ATPase family protein [Rhodopseudomonas julia]MDQ0325812.1 glucosamine kinase [Rhodopseudomonas julia]
MERTILAVDAGGTKCRARLVAPDGTVLASGEGGACNPSTDLAGAIAVLDALINVLCRQTNPATERRSVVLSLGVAGLVDVGRRTSFLAAAEGFAEIVAMSDGYAALIGAGGGQPARLVILGTGAAGHRLFADGTSIQRDGWGFLGGDRGSGAWLGRRAVEAALKSYDGAAPESLLSQRLTARLGGNEAAILDWLLQARPRDFASLVLEIVAAAEAGDGAADALLEAAADEAAALVRSLGERERGESGRGEGEGEPLYLLGGLSELLRTRIETRLNQRFGVPQGGALDGCLLVARRQAPQERRR